jgi:hypothetical protein
LQAAPNAILTTFFKEFATVNPKTKDTFTEQDLVRRKTKTTGILKERLKEMCKELDIPTSGSKADLVDRILKPVDPTHYWWAKTAP